MSCFPQQDDDPEAGSTQGGCSSSFGNPVRKFLWCFSQKHQNGETSVCLSIGLFPNHSWVCLGSRLTRLWLLWNQRERMIHSILSWWDLSPPVHPLWVTSHGGVKSNRHARRCVDKGRKENKTTTENMLSLDLSPPLASGPPC